MPSDSHLEGQTRILAYQSTCILLLKICISTNGVTRILEFSIPYTLY